MDNVRLLLAIGLSFLVLFVWSMFFTDPQPAIDNQETVSTEKTPAEAQAPDKAADMTTDTISQEEVAAIKTAQAMENPAREVNVQTPFYSVRISAKGATFTSFILKKYRESVEDDSANKQLIPVESKNGVIRTTLAGNALHGLDEAIFSIDQTEDHLVVADAKKSLVFQWVADDGTVVTKTYTFDPDSYLIDLKVGLKNGSDKMLRDKLVLSVRKPVEEESGYGFVGPSGLINDKLQQIKIKKIEDQDEIKGNIKWISC